MVPTVFATDRHMESPMSDTGDQGRADLEKERDTYLQALYALTRKDFTFTDEELRALQENGLTLQEIIEELETSPEI
jgi:hypothetical protein